MRKQDERSRNEDSGDLSEGEGKEERHFGAGSNRTGESSPSSGNPSLDDRAVLEDLEKQRALIKAELDSQLMEGKVQSGMGLILQGYNSGSEEDGDAMFRNGEQRPRGSSGKLISPKGEKGGKSRRDSIDGSKSGSKRHSRSKSADKPPKEPKPDKGTKSSEEPAAKDRSPHRRGPHSPARRRSASPRHRDAHHPSASASDKTSKHSPPRRSPAGRARSHSPEARRREADRQDSPLRVSRSPLRRRSPPLPCRSRSSPQRRIRFPLRFAL